MIACQIPGTRSANAFSFKQMQTIPMLPPIFFHCFRHPLPYASTLALQEQLHNIQLSHRRLSAHKDILLLLQHRPVYTSGRRQTDPSLQDEKTRLTAIGADFVPATRGGQLTYHGPGQIVGYPLMDLGRYTPIMGAREYVCRMQKMLERHLDEAHGIKHCPSEHTGVFLDAKTKLASIGVQVRHRLTSHGFALNVTREPLAWFDKVIACGLDDVKAGSIETAKGAAVGIEKEMAGLAEWFGRTYEREMMELDVKEEEEIGKAILALEKEAQALGNWNSTPS
ncbi:uncharacterized protein LACBIDRAFT_300933 [Laccaria bicolor S238N-H82]|uniref:lipoyl(octanoyl) transferase n=1 Tax=Laccaria bicolor (strain S238N-H82 / ATCC MYA-4686) TaxID=486041 RepID=B0CQX5_LACBS|nr:uncharacterized protein LACBIDRAFT_300933 [Laccaria bicolor S238N-H82]EDR15110.1 predicted protein [Laccaria bicolor S238N-H82]|eukprot:XP_001873318.1 predicted protein [Laccaria bicolor S238N-H82]